MINLLSYNHSFLLIKNSAKIILSVLWVTSLIHYWFRILKRRFFTFLILLQIDFLIQIFFFSVSIFFLLESKNRKFETNHSRYNNLSNVIFLKWSYLITFSFILWSCSDRKIWELITFVFAKTLWAGRSLGFVLFVECTLVLNTVPSLCF